MSPGSSPDFTLCRKFTIAKYSAVSLTSGLTYYLKHDLDSLSPPSFKGV